MLGSTASRSGSPDCNVQQANDTLGCKTALGNILWTSYSLFLLKLGVSFQPLQSSYCRFSFLATHCWMKMMWEKTDMFGITKQTANSSFQFPWKGKMFLMLVSMDYDHSCKALMCLDRVRVHQQISFMSDVLSLSEQKIDPSMLECCCCGEHFSSMRWPNKDLTESNFLLWKQALEDVCPSRQRTLTVHTYVVEMHQMHPWQWCPETDTLLHLLPKSTSMQYNQEVILVHKNILQPARAGRGNCWVHWHLPDCIHGPQSPLGPSPQIFCWCPLQMGLPVAMETHIHWVRDTLDFSCCPRWIPGGGDWWLLHQMPLPTSMLGNLCPWVRKGSWANHPLLCRSYPSGKRIQRKTPWHNGNKPPPCQR